LNYKEPNIIEQLAFLSVKHSVYISELYEALVSAKENKKAICGDLTVEYRGNVKNQVIFLITKGSAVIVQFRVAEDFLSRKNISFESWLNTDKIRKQVAKQNSKSDSTSISDLKHGMRKVNVKGEVLSIEKPQLIRTQYGNSVLLTNASITDETGEIRVCLWGEQPTSLGVGDIVQINCGAVRAFKGEKQLSIGTHGTISVVQCKADREQTSISQKTSFA
jgi:replication factor A1